MSELMLLKDIAMRADLLGKLCTAPYSPDVGELLSRLLAIEWCRPVSRGAFICKNIQHFMSIEAFELIVARWALKLSVTDIRKIVSISARRGTHEYICAMIRCDAMHIHYAWIGFCISFHPEFIVPVYNTMLTYNKRIMDPDLNLHIARRIAVGAMPLACLRLVVQYGIDVNDEELLRRAVSSKQYDCANALIHYGAKGDRVDPKTGMTPYELAKSMGYEKMVMLMERTGTACVSNVKAEIKSE